MYKSKAVTRWLVIAKSNKKNVPKNNKGCGNQYSEKKATFQIYLAVYIEIKYQQCQSLEIKLTSDLNILDRHHFVQNKVGKCNIGNELNWSQGCKKWLHGMKEKKGGRR